MAKILERKTALELRATGKSYSQIRKELGVSKSTLSYWLRNHPLNKEQLVLLRDWNQVRIEKFRQTMKSKREKRWEIVLEEQKRTLLPLSERELFLAGLFLYWGEGAKTRGHVSISNTDPKILKFALYWLVEILNIPKERIRIGLHLYKDMSVSEEIKYWSRVLGISKSQFNKPYIKKSNRVGLSYKGFGHGTCNLVCCSVELSEKIAMSIKAVSDYYGEKSDLFWYN